MPIFDNNGKKQNVQDAHIGKYMKLYPDATTVMERDGKKYRVKAKDYNTFLGDTLEAPKMESAPQPAPQVEVDAAKQAMQKPRGGENGYTFTAEELGIAEGKGKVEAAPVELQYDGTKPVVPGMAKEGDIPGMNMEAYNANMAKAMAEGKVLSPQETQRRFEEREAEVAARLPHANASMLQKMHEGATMQGAFDRAYGAAKGVYYADEAERLTKGLLDEYSAERAKRLSQVEKDVENYNSARRWAVSNPYATDAYSEVAYRSNVTKLRNADELGMMEEFAKDAKKRLLADENLKAKAEENAELLGMPVERYINEVAVPIMQERMYSEWLAPQEERAKRNYNGFAAAAEGSLIGTLLGATRTDTEKYLSQVGQEAWRKNASLLDRAAAGAGSMFLDLPVFMGAGSLAAQPAKAVGGQVFKQLAKNETKRLVARGVAEGAAQRYANYAVRNGLKNRILLNLSTAPLQSGLTFGVFDAGKTALNMSLGGEWDWSELGKSAVGGTLMGGALGVTGAVGGGLTHGLTGATKAAAKVAEFGVENAVFTEGGRLIGKLHGQQPENGWLEDYVESGATLLMIKAPNIVKNVSAIKGDKEASEVFSFNKLEREQLGKYGEDLNSVLESLLPQSAKLYEDGLKISEGTFTEEYRRVMSDPEVSMTTKAKLMGIVEGKVMPAPRVTDVKIEGDRVMTYDPMGQLVEVKEYATEAKANAEYKKAADKAEIENIAVLEDVYMRIKGYEADELTVKEWLAKNPKVTMERVAEIVAKNSVGEKLTEAEQKILESLRQARREGLNDVRHLNDVLAGLDVDAKDVMSGLDKPIDKRTERENRAVRAYTDVLFREVKDKIQEPYRRGEAQRAADDVWRAANNVKWANEDVKLLADRIYESDRSVDETANDGMVYTTTTPSGERIIITGGKVVLDNEGYIDVNQSEGLVAMFPDGQKKPVRPGDLREKVEVSNAEEMKAVKREEIVESGRVKGENGKLVPGAEIEVAFEGEIYKLKVDGRDERGDIILSGEGASMALPESVVQDAMKQAETLQAESGTSGRRPEGPKVEGENEVVPSENQSTVPTAEEVADAQAFADAYAANTLEAYQNYLDNHPEGAYRDGARRGIWALEGTISVADIASITNAENVLQRAAANEVQTEVAPVVEGQKGENTVESSPTGEVAAFEQNIPVDEKGKKMWEQSTPEYIAEYIRVRKPEDVEAQMSVVSGMIEGLEKQKSKMDAMDAMDIDDKIAFWKKVGELIGGAKDVVDPILQLNAKHSSALTAFNSMLENIRREGNEQKAAIRYEGLENMVAELGKQLPEGYTIGVVDGKYTIVEAQPAETTPVVESAPVAEVETPQATNEMQEADLENVEKGEKGQKVVEPGGENKPKVRGRKQVEKALEKMRKADAEGNALEVLNNIQTAELNAERGDEGAITPEEQAEIDALKKKYAEQGYEVQDLTGKEYVEGWKVTAEFEDDATLPEGEMVVKRTRKPFIMKDGVMVQVADIIVAKGTKKAEPTLSQTSDQAAEGVDGTENALGETDAPSLLDVVKTLYSKGKEVASRLFSMKFFDVAKTPGFMQELGLRGDKFTIKYGVIARHLGKDGSHDLSEKDWEQLPQALQNPFAISKLTDKKDSYRIYTTLQTESGEFVVVGADVKNAGREIEVNAVSTVFGRRNNANLPKNEEVIYRSKEITPEQSSLLERPNFAQYPTEQELSIDEGTTQSAKVQENSQKSGEDELDVYLAEMKAAQERQKAFAQKSPRPSSFVEAYTANDAELIKRLDKQFNDALQTLVPLDIPAIEATIRGMKDRKSTIKAGSANGRKETPAYKAFDHIEKALAKRKKQLEKELAEADKRRIDIIKRGNRGELKETTQPKQEKASQGERSKGKTESESKPEVEKIEDVGEKIGGAKKDRFAEGMARIKAELEETDETLTDKLAKLPVSQVFNFDLEKLREGGISNEAISFIKIVKDYLPAKPRKTYKIRSWVNNTLALYKLCLEAGTNWDRVNTLLNGPQFTSSSLKEQFDAYMAIGGFDSGMNIGNAKLRQLDKTSGIYDESGKFVTLEGKWYVSDAGKHGGIYDTKEEAVDALKAFAGDKAGVTSDGKKKEVKFAVYQRRQDKSIFIAVKGKSDIVIQDGFKSSKEAFDYIEANNAELQERYRALLDKTNADFEDNRPREGRDYRDGKDIPAEEFRTTFGFRGVEFGNWMTQEDRRKALNECYDALMDLAAVCKVSPQALSLGGTLGMAFGARGGGRFSAHYEPGKLVINLTKTKGAGSLAHEWFHALDNYFAKMGSEGLDVYATAGEGLFPEGISSIGKRYYDGKSGQMLTEEEYNERMNSHEVRREMADAWKSLMETLKKSDYYKRSAAYAGLHNSKYWARPTELGARAFSTWVENELSKQGASNDYLANNPRFLVSEATDEQSRFMPYPFDADATWMEEAFGNLFEVMQEKTTEDGKAVLYSIAEDAMLKDKGTEAFERATKVTMDAVERLKANGLDIEVVSQEEANEMTELADGAEQMTVFHGSGARFDKFDHSHMGEGEGAQIYGWGTYVTEVEGIGRAYANSVTANRGAHIAYNGKPLLDVIDGMGHWWKVNKNRLASAGSAADLRSVIEGLRIGENANERTAKRFELQRNELLAAIDNGEITVEKPRNLYTIEVPDDNGSNYLHWDKPINGEIQERIANGLQSIGFEIEPDMNHLAYSRDGKIAVLNINAKGKDLYAELSEVLGGDKQASLFLSDMGFVGISYPAEAQSGGRADGARNYVIFNEDDAVIKDRVEFLRAANGKVYGWAVDGKIRLTPDGINPNTPVHEYAHLWGADVEKNNPKLWNEVVEAMKLSPVWNEVSNDANYSNIHGNDSRMASEVLARLSGRENYRRTIEQAEKEIAAERDIVGKVQKKGILNRIKNALKNFWDWVQRNVFKRGERSNVKAEPWDVFVNKSLKDFDEGVNPDAYMRAVENGDMETAERLVKEAAKRAMPDTKVVDEDGYPMVVYHGSADEFTVFGKDISKKRVHTRDNSYFFSKEKAVSEDYGDVLYGAYLDLRNPLVVDFEGRTWRNTREVISVYYARNNEVLKSGFASEEEASEWREQFLKDDNNTYSKDADYVKVGPTIEQVGPSADEYVAKAQAEGYDGLIIENIVDAAGGGWVLDENNRYTIRKTAGAEIATTDYVAFSPSQIKSADAVTYDDNGNVIPLSERFNEEKEDIRFHFIGKKGAENLDKAEEATTRLDNLNVAREMESGGKDAKAIKLATGWERGADGKWRYETEDVKVNRGAELFSLETYKSYPIARSIEIGRVDENSTIRLTDLVKDDELFKAYPEMEEYFVSFEKMDADGSHSFEEKMIRINKDDIHSLGSTLVHEIQHAIQSLEGFAKGGNTESVATKAQTFRQEVYPLHNKMLDTPEWAEKQRLLNRWLAEEDKTEPDRDYQAQLQKRIEEIDGSGVLKEIEDAQAELIKKYGYDRNVINVINKPYSEDAEIWNNLPDFFYDKYDAYKSLAGEVESRNVQERMGMTPEERRNKLAEETEDVRRKDQIFLEKNLGVSANDEAKKESAEKSAVKNNANFVSTYKTKDGKDIEYTSERAEGYGIQGGGTGNSYDGTGNSILQRQTDTGVPGANSGLNEDKGEFCVVERVFTENGAFNFTSGEKIESADDVAYIFSALEDAAKEHSFVVYVKDGKPTVIELGMGSFNATMVDIPTASLAYSRINPDHVYFVHNHPSGNLVCSGEDVAMLRVFEDMSDVPVTGVIINLKTGKYGTFDTERHSVIGEKRVPENEERLTVHTLDKQIFAPDYDPMAQPLVRSSQDVAQFLNSQRMGDRPKVSFLILSRANRIIGNIHTPFTDITTDTEAVARYINERVIQFGGENAILYGDFAISMDESRGFRLLQGAMERFGKTKLSDVVHVEGNFTKSAIDLGLLYEPETEYNLAKENGERYNSPEQDIPVGEVESQPVSRIDLSNGPVKGVNEPEWKFKARREKWKRWVESNTSVKIPMPEKPFLQEGESVEEYEARMKEFNKELNKWKKDILSNESEIEQMMNILYDGKVPEMNPTPEDEFTEQVFKRYMGDDGIRVDRKSMRGMIMDEIIERRRKIETNNFDDVVFINEVRKATTAEQRKAIPFIIEGTYNGEVSKELAAVVRRVKDWFENVYQALQAADAMHSSGKIKNYVTHIWDKNRTPKAVYENYINTRSKYTNRRSIETYAEGIALGMVPKYDDICDIMLEYGHIANEAIANKDFTDFLHMLRVDGEPVLKDATIRDPMYVRTSAEALDGYKVHKYAKGIVETVLGNIRTENAAEWMQKLAHFYDVMGSLMKKINLSLSFFHHGALIETAVGAMGPAKTISTVFKNLVWDCMRSGELPALSNPEAARNAVNHLVQLGATQDYMAKEVNRLTGQLKGMLQDFSDKHPNFATKSIVKPAELLDFLNTGFDKVLWDYLHDGLKIYTFDKYAKEIEEYCKKKGVDDTTKDMLLNEAGQFVNDTFGGQFWELINQSPATVKWLRRFLLSPDWTVSTIRQALAPLGFGTLYKDYERNWFKRTFSGIPEAVKQRRKMGAKFWITAMLTFIPLMNALNAWRRKEDVDEELAKAEERRKTDPEYKSPYELKYPDGMKWYDYTMYGNTIGHQTHLFGWRYDDDKEGYIRWGKQFRELPELFLGKDGFSFPGPMIDKMVGKANPALSASLAFLGYAKDGWQSKWMKDKKGWEKELGRVMGFVSAFTPYSIPTDEDKEFVLTDLMMPSSKGFSNYKAIREFETAILAQDFDYVGAVYDACVMNKLDAEKLLQAAIARVEAQAKAEYVEGANTLNEAWDKYQEDLDVNEKRAVRTKFNKLLQENAYKDFEKQEARDMVQSVLDGTYREEKLPEAYIASETAEDVRDAYKMDAIRLRLKKVVDDIPEGAEAYKQYYKENEAKIDLYDKVVAAKREINFIMEDIKITPQYTEQYMQEIRDIRREVIELANNLTSNNE